MNTQPKTETCLVPVAMTPPQVDAEAQNIEPHAFEKIVLKPHEAPNLNALRSSASQVLPRLRDKRQALAEEISRLNHDLACLDLEIRLLEDISAAVNDCVGKEGE